MIELEFPRVGEFRKVRLCGRAQRPSVDTATVVFSSSFFYFLPVGSDDDGVSF